MVWDTTQSTLYTLGGAVERHNAGFGVAYAGSGEAAESAEYAKAEPPSALPESEKICQEPCSTPLENIEEADEAANFEQYTQSEHTESPSPHIPQPEMASEPVRAKTERVGSCERHEEVPKEECNPLRLCDDCPRRCPKCGKPLPASKPSNPLEALLADKDTLLLAALILLLWHEKADIKLIGALAFILFSN